MRAGKEFNEDVYVTHKERNVMNNVSVTKQPKIYMFMYNNYGHIVWN